MDGDLIRINKNKIFAIQNDKNNFVVTITEKASDGSRNKRVYKSWESVPVADREEYFAARAYKNAQKINKIIVNNSNKVEKK